MIKILGGMEWMYEVKEKQELCIFKYIIIQFYVFKYTIV